jgi:glycosyltransferase involved in cell wall biosynthesis
VLLPSLKEGLPGVVLEACAAGAPVLASDLPGVREIAAQLPGVEFLSLSAGDREWAARALALAEDPENPHDRRAPIDLFRNSVFHVDRAADAHRVLWKRHLRRNPDAPVQQPI